MLVTAYIVDGQVSLELENLISTANGRRHDELLREHVEVDGNELLDMSDEERVVYEIKRYRAALLDSGHVAAEDVLDIAQAIVGWRK